MSISTSAYRTTTDLRAKIREYYDGTLWDYRFIWRSARYRAYHFGFYDEQTRSHASALLNTNQALASRAQVASTHRVLDAGCGIGGSSIWLAEKLDAAVVGITPVLTQVREARRQAMALRPTLRVWFLPADYTVAPFPDCSFDVVWALESICHAPDKEKFYAEAARVLRPGGRLVAAEYMRTDRHLDAHGKRLMAQWFEGWAIPDLATRDEHLRYAQAAGFVRIKIEDVTSHTRRSLRRLYWIARLCQPFAVVAHLLRWRSATQHGNFISALRQYQTLERSYWRYHLVSAIKPPSAHHQRAPGHRD